MSEEDKAKDAPGKGALGPVDIQQILKMLPHRYPFLLVDRMLEVNEDFSGVGIKNVTVNEPHFTGHFPSSRSCRAC